MKEWLDRQKDIEGEVLEAASQQAYEVVDQLLPQIRLAAMENSMVVKANLEITFDFSDKETKVSCLGAVTFPVKVVEAQSVKVNDKEV